MVYATPGDVFDDLAANHALLREAETRELALIAEACDAYLVDEFGADAACEKLIRGGADGTPLVGEFLALELAGLLHTSAASAATRIAEVLNLRHRHPELWERVAAGRVEAFKALEVARRCAQAGLSLEAARWVDHQLALCLVGLPWGRAMRLLSGVDHGSRPRQATLFVHIAADTIYGDWDQQLVPTPGTGARAASRCPAIRPTRPTRSRRPGVNCVRFPEPSDVRCRACDWLMRGWGVRWICSPRGWLASRRSGRWTR